MDACRKRPAMIYFGPKDSLSYMKTHHPDNPAAEEASGKRDVRFCLNCDDMDDLAISDDAKDIDKARYRFQNCEHLGRFDGDVCSRLFVVEPSEDPGPLFDDEPE